MLRQRIFIRVLILASIMVLLTCNRGKIEGPVGPVEETTVKINNVVASPSEIATGGYTSTITTTILDDQNAPVKDELVQFGELTALGSLSRTADSTDANGHASTQFTSGNQAGTAQILVAAGSDQDTVEISLQTVVATLDTAYANSYDIIAPTGFTQLTARVLDSDGNPISGVNVLFAELTNLGSISPASDTTDVTGMAYSEFSAGSDSGTALIRVSVGGNSDTLHIHISPPNYFISLNADPAEPLADGETQVHITASALDQTLDPINGLQIRITSSNTEILSSRKVTTNASGNAEFVVTAPASTADVPLEIYAQLSGFSGNAPINSPTIKPVFSGNSLMDGQSVASPVLSDRHTASSFQDVTTANQRKVSLRQPVNNSDTLSVIFSGVNLTLSSTRDTLLANGSSQSALTLTALRANGDPIGEHAINLQGSLGVIPSNISTNAFGQVYTTFTAGVVPGTAQIRAKIGEVSSNTVQIVLVERSAGSINLTANRNSIRGDGSMTATITAQVLDNSGDPLNGQPVNFSTDLGTLNQSTATTQNGEASVTLTAPVLANNQTATVTATLPGTSTETTIPIDIRGLQLTLTSSRQSMPANSTSEAIITAQLKELSTNRIVPGKSIDFSTTNGSIQGSATTDSSGIATVTLTAGNIPDPNVIVTASYRDVVTRTQSLVFKSATPFYIDLSAEPQQVYIQGVDGIKTSVITASVADVDSVPVQNVTMTFSTNRGYLTSDLNPSGSNSVPASVYNGEAQVTFHSDTVTTTGVATITVSSSTVSKSVPLITIIGAEPNQILLGIGPRNDLDNGIYQADVSAVVEDIYGNPVGAGTMVYFSLIPPSDTLATIGASAPTDIDGVATVQVSYPSDHFGHTIRVRAVVNGTVTKIKDLLLP